MKKCSLKNTLLNDLKTIQLSYIYLSSLNTIMRSLLCIFLVVLLTVCASFRSHGQTTQLNFTHYDEDDGLSENSINSLYQDSRGFIWIGTALGFNRFDGKNFKKFYPKDLLLHHQNKEFCKVFFENEQQSLICLIGNLEAYTFHTVSQKLYPINALKNRTCTNFQRLDDHSIAVSTMDTLLVFDNQFHFKYHIIPPTFQKEMSVQVRKLDYRTLLVYTPNEHFIYDLQTKKFVALNYQIPIEENHKTGFSVLHWDENKREIYISNYFKGLYIVNLKGEVLYHWHNQRKGEKLVANCNGFMLDPFQKNWAWLSGENGLSKVNLQTKQIINLHNINHSHGSFSPVNITRFIFDNTKNLWIATPKGLFRKNELSEFIRIHPLPETKEVEFMNMVQAVDGNFYISTYFGPVWKLSRKDGTIKEIKGFSKKGSWFVFSDGAYIVQGGSGTSLNYMHSLTKKHTTRYFLDRLFPQSDLIVLGFRHSNGDIWFSGNQKGGLVRYDFKTKEYSRFSSALKNFSDSYFTCYAESADGDLWFGSNRSSALVHWDSRTEKFHEINFKEIFTQKGILRSGINVIRADQKGQIWIGFDGSGLLQYNPKTKTFLTFNRSDGLPSNFIHNLIFDDKNRLWIGTNKGLSCFFPNSKKVISYNQKNGFPCESITSNCGLFDEEKKEVWMTTGNLLFSFQPEQIIRRNKGKINVFIDEFVVNNVSMLSHPNAHFKLKPTQNNLRIRFGAVHAHSDREVEYSYRLYGGSPTWIYCDAQNQINFPNLSPGEYEFLVRARFKGAPKWTWLKSNLTFTVLLPWYKSWWFILLICLGTLLISHFIIRMYLAKKIALQKATTERQLAVQMERERIAFDMHDDLGSGLTKISYLSKAAVKKVAKIEELEKIQNTSLELVENMSELIWAMKVENDSLVNLLTYIKHYAVDYLDGNSLVNTFQLPEIQSDFYVSGETRRNIFLMVKEALHNIVKHASATEVAIQIELNDVLRILIKDNGKGLPIAMNKKSDGTGLSSMRNRAERLGGSVTLQSASGTQIEFRFPLLNIRL